MTTTNETPTALHVPARDIPVPTSVSVEAQAILAMGMLAVPTEWPALDDAAGWKKLVVESDELMASLMPKTFSGDATEGAEVDDHDLGGFVVYKITPDGVTPDDPRVYLDVHGGAFVFGAGRLALLPAVHTAKQIGARVWSVDYRMPPDHPFPTPLDDCVAAYRALLEERSPDEIVVGGGSAGGNLAAALVLRARDEGLPLPAACVLNTPATDLTGSGDTWNTNDGLDSVLRGSYMPCLQLYAGGHDLRDPYLSPVYADLADGFPPTILSSGTRDRLLSDTVRFHRALRAAGIEAELHVFEAGGHAMFLEMAPEDAERARENRRFVHEHWARVRA